MTHNEEKSEQVQNRKSQIRRTYANMLGNRYRSFRTRDVSNVLPADCRLFLKHARESPDRFSLLFTPGFSDMVNDTVRMARDLCILSDAYRESDLARASFLYQVTRDRNGVHVPSLLRKQDSVNYMRVDFKDVLMFHPNAWGFPEADLSRTLLGPLGQTRDPAFGWLRQEPSKDASELEDTTFSYTSVLHTLPKDTVAATVAGNPPEWLRDVSKITADSSVITQLEQKLGGTWELKRLLAAGLIEASKVYVKMADLGNLMCVEPERLATDRKLEFSLKGVHALRLFLGSKARSHVHISPFQIETLAFQLGIRGEYHYYWVCFFVLNIPIPFGWIVELEDDVRTYINLSSGHKQRIHPGRQQFLWMAQSLHMAEIVWDSRGSVKIPCDDCGAPDSILFCLQCLGFMCYGCFMQVHKTRTKHYAIPYVGSRYLTPEEVETLSPRLHLTNVGFCNRRRFLARTNQSDKTGACQCEWLHFDTIEAYRTIAHQVESEEMDHRILKSIEAGKGFFYNFANGKVTDDPNEFLSISKKQQAMALLIQSWFRGLRGRRYVRHIIRSATVIQKNVRMYIARAKYKLVGREGPLAQWFQWYDLFVQRRVMIRGILKVQALARMIQMREWYQRMKAATTRIQALFRGCITRRRIIQMNDGALFIQRVWRGRRYGFLVVMARHEAAIRIQSVTRGRLERRHRKKLSIACLKIQSLARSFLTRQHEARRHRSAILLQTWWRRFLSIVEIKFKLINEFEGVLKQYDDRIRIRAMESASILVQKRFRGHSQRLSFMKFKHLATSVARPLASVAACSFLACCSIHLPLHLWFRYLPENVRERMGPLKNIIQNGIVRSFSGTDLAAAVFRLVVKRLLSICCSRKDDVHQLLKIVSRTLCQSFASAKNTHPITLRTTQLGSGHVPANPDDSLLTFENKCMKPYLHSADKRIKQESVAWSAILLNEPGVVSSVLIPFREFLDQPRLKLDSNLSFQGVDPQRAYQINDIVSVELGLDLPISDLVRYTDCNSVANSVSTIIHHARVSTGPASRASRPVDFSKFDSFTFGQIGEILRQLSRCLRKPDTEEELVKYSRHLHEVDAVLDECKKSVQQEHHEYVGCAVLTHLIARGMIMKELWHRAAQIIQTRFRYYCTRTLVKRHLRPALIIQRFWRGLRTALELTRKDQAAALIQRNVKTVFSNQRNKQLRMSVITIQACWRGHVQRKYLKLADQRALLIQKVFRGHLVRLYIGSPEGRAIRQSFSVKLKDTGNIHELRHATLIAYRVSLENQKRAVLSVKQSRARLIQRKVDQYRRTLPTFSSNRRNTKRQSPFEPMVFARRREMLRGKQGPTATKERSQIVLGAESIIETLKRSFV
jgi:hypothetical protein